MRFSQVSADTGVFAALADTGDVLVWSTSHRSGFGNEGGGAVKLSKRARRISVADNFVWVIESSSFPGKESGKPTKDRKGEAGRLWRFRNDEDTPTLYDKFRTVGGALLESPLVEEVSACGGGVLAIVQSDDDAGMYENE